MKNKQIPIGTLDIPKEYFNLTDEQKNELVGTLMERMINYVDKRLLPNYDRITVLKEILESSRISNEKEQNYEVCQVILDVEKRLNEYTS